MSNNTINKEEVEKFSKIAEEWWNPNGKFKPLHKFNPIRIEYIKNNIIKDFNISSNQKPLKGVSILDIGCGGGLLSEPLARLGAEVVGIDASKKNIDIAKHHLKKSNLKIDYHDIQCLNCFFLNDVLQYQYFFWTHRYPQHLLQVLLKVRIVSLLHIQYQEYLFLLMFCDLMKC